MPDQAAEEYKHNHLRLRGVEKYKKKNNSDKCTGAEQ